MGKCCGTCRYHWKHVWNGPGDAHKDDWWCANEMADCYGAYTDYNDGFLCGVYEERELRQRTLSDSVERAVRKMNGGYTI